MKKVLATFLATGLILTLVGMPSAVAGKNKKRKPPVTRQITFEESGSMMVMGPTGAAFSGVTEFEFYDVHSCASMPTSQGVDGWVVEIPEDFRQGTATIEVIGTDATGSHDLNVYFFAERCELMADVWLTEGADASGWVPPGAAWAVVNLIRGADATFNLKATAPISE